MIKRIIQRMKIFSFLLKLSKEDPNDYSFGYKTRRVLRLYKEGKEIEEEEILKQNPKV